MLSYIFFAITLPISIFLSLKIVKGLYFKLKLLTKKYRIHNNVLNNEEYERAVILRLGRILQGGGKYTIKLFLLHHSL